MNEVLPLSWHLMIFVFDWQVTFIHMYEVMMTWLDSHTRWMLANCSMLQTPSVQALVTSAADWSSAKPACGLVFCLDKSSRSTCAHLYTALPRKQGVSCNHGTPAIMERWTGPLVSHASWEGLPLYYRESIFVRWVGCKISQLWSETFS